MSCPYHRRPEQAGSVQRSHIYNDISDFYLEGTTLHSAFLLKVLEDLYFCLFHTTFWCCLMYSFIFSSICTYSNLYWWQSDLFQGCYPKRLLICREISTFLLVISTILIFILYFQHAFWTFCLSSNLILTFMNIKFTQNIQNILILSNDWHQIQYNWFRYT